MLNKVLEFFKQQAVFYCLLFLLLISQPLRAAVEPGISTTSELAIQVFLGLMLVLSLMFALAWLAKRMRLVPGTVGGQNAIRTLAVVSLGSREKLLLVQVGEEQLLLGVTNQQITCLHELKTPIDLNVAKSKPAFAQFMQQWSVKNQLTATQTEEKKVD